LRKKRMKRVAKVTSKGRVTVPRDFRRKLGLHAGDTLLFEENAGVVRVSRMRKESAFEKYRGIGSPGIGKGRKGIQK
jgi:antitoxin PrlF